MSIDVTNTDARPSRPSRPGRAVGVSSTATAAMHPQPDVRYIPLTDARPVEVHLAWPDPPPGHPGVPDLIEFIDRLVGQSADRNRRRTRLS